MCVLLLLLDIIDGEGRKAAWKAKKVFLFFLALWMRSHILEESAEQNVPPLSLSLSLSLSPSLSLSSPLFLSCPSGAESKEEEGEEEEKRG